MNIYSNLISAVGTQHFDSIKDIKNQGSSLLYNKNKINLGVITPSKTVVTTSGSDVDISDSNTPSIINASVISTVTNKNSSIDTNAIGVSVVYNIDSVLSAIINASGINIDDKIYQTDWGKNLLNKLKKQLKNSNNAVNGGIFSFIDSDGLSYFNANTIQKCFDILIDDGAFDKDGNNLNYSTTFDPNYVIVDFNGFIKYFVNALDEAENYKHTLQLSLILDLFWNKKIALSSTDLIQVTGGYYTFEDPFYEYVKVEIYHNVNNVTISKDDNNIEFHFNYNTKREIQIAFKNNMNPIYTYDREYDYISDVRIRQNIQYKPSIVGTAQAVNYGTLVYKKTGVILEQDAVLPIKDGTIESEYPTWFNKTKTITNIDSLITKYVPLSIPLNSSLVNQNNQSGAQSGTTTKTTINAISNAVDLANNSGLNIPTNLPSDSIGSTPNIVMPTGGVDIGFISIYNPTINELKLFCRYLWSIGTDVSDVLKRLFQTPIQAIVGLLQVYAPKPTSVAKNIMLGILDTNVASRVCTEQYIVLDCGTITINEYYTNYLDYKYYTTVTLYLPFIGFVNLDINDIIKSKINVKYNIDLVTGSCVAYVTIKKDSMNAVLYTYNGNCSIQIPITSTNYNSLVSNVITTATSAIATVVSGGATASMLASSATGLLNSNIGIQRSGSTSSTFGAMNIKTPYLIINRKQDVTPLNFNKYVGQSASRTIKLNYLDGFTRIKEAHIEFNNATEQEQIMIKNLLIGGVIL